MIRDKRVIRMTELFTVFVHLYQSPIFSSEDGWNVYWSRCFEPIYHCNVFLEFFIIAN